MKRAMILASAALALAACAQEPAVDAPTFDLSLYTACSVMEPTDERLASDGCILSDEAMTHALVVTRGVNAVSIQAVMDGEPGQLMEETVAEGQALPSLEDINGDGRPDLLIPRETGNVNTVQAVWLAGEGSGAYTRLGEIAGIGHSRTADGLLAVPARSSAAAVEITFYRIEPTALAEAAVVTVTGEPRPDGSLATRCELTRKPEGETFTDAQMQEKFCAEPVATGVFE